MRVQEVNLDNNQRRYLLLDDNGLPIIPVARYLKYIKIYRVVKYICKK